MKVPSLALAPALALLLAAAAIAADAAAQQRKPAPEPPAKASECAAMGELPKAWDGQAFAVDGNTLAATGLKPHLRLWGIQTPELRDAARAESVPGMRARAWLAELLAKGDHKVKCRPARFDHECHLVAQCSVGDLDLAGSLLAAGMAYTGDLSEGLPWESRAGQRYADAEVEARKGRKGLWPVWLGEP